jgi:uncharacterized membrane protein (UPF0182 family)
MQPYYILMKLPGSDQLEYLLMTPFTPQKRNNMISWMAARCDFPEYGKMLFYELPKEKLIYGPMQIEAMIDQNTTIAQQLTLWDQKGSRVIRGNLIAVPIENSFLYVVPLYLTAEGTDFPQLKRVIVISGDKVAMEPTLDEAIQAVFGTQPPQNAAQAPRGTRNWARRGRSSMRPRRQCSRGIGELRQGDGRAQALAERVTAARPSRYRGPWFPSERGSLTGGADNLHRHRCDELPAARFRSGLGPGAYQDRCD